MTVIALWGSRCSTSRAADRTSRPVEGGENTIPGRLDLTTPVPFDLTSDEGVVGGQGGLPGAVTDARAVQVGTADADTDGYSSELEP